MGRHPGPRPSRASRSKEWREDMREYDKRARRVEEDCAAALSLLERSFPYGTTPAHIIDKTIKNVPEGVPLTQWTYRRKFSSCWDALRLEYQPSSSTDLKQLKEHISKLTDEGRGGFDELWRPHHRSPAPLLRRRLILNSPRFSWPHRLLSLPWRPRKFLRQIFQAKSRCYLIHPRRDQGTLPARRRSNLRHQYMPKDRQTYSSSR